MKKRFAFGLVLLVVLVGLLAGVPAFLRSTLAGPLEKPLLGGGWQSFACADPPDRIGDWSRVKYIMDWSGCSDGKRPDSEDIICWTEWIQTANPVAWYEGPKRYDREKNEGSKEPPQIYPNPVVADERDYCYLENCEGRDLVGGIWYVNRVARPVFPEDPGWNEGQMIFECDWVLDERVHYWFFGEDDVCQDCKSACYEVTPTPVPGITPTPGPTYPPVEVCTPKPLTPTPGPTGTVPPTRIPPPDVSVSPHALARSPRTPPGTWYRTAQDFYWLYQERLYIKLWGEATAEPLLGCRVSSARVIQTYLEKINGQRVCPQWNFPDSPFPAPRNTLYDRETFCGWRDDTDGNAMVLLWSNQRMPPQGDTQGNLLNQYGVTPWHPNLDDYPVKPGWIELEYTVQTATTYTCSGFTRTTYDYFDGQVVRVKLVKPVRVWRR